MKLRAFVDNKIVFLSENNPWKIYLKNNQIVADISLDGKEFLGVPVSRYVTSVVSDRHHEWEELYEGDIVEVKFRKNLKFYEEETVTKIAKCLWNEDSAQFVLQWNYNKHQHSISLQDPWKSITVIGNEFQQELELSDGNCWD